MPASFFSRMLRGAEPFADLRPQLAVPFVVEEQGRSLGAEQARDFADHLAQQRRQVYFRTDVGHHIEEFQFLRAQPAHPIHQLAVAQHRRGLGADGFQQIEVVVGKLTLALVQALDDADDLAGGGSDRRAENVLGAEPRLPVDAAIEARVGIGIVDDGAGARREHVAGDSVGAQEPDFAGDFALRDPRVQFIGVAVVKEQRSPFGVGHRCADVHQGFQHLVQGLGRGQNPADAEQRLGALQPVLGLARENPRQLARFGDGRSGIAHGLNYP